jgi:hypothetical protein
MAHPTKFFAIKLSPSAYPPIGIPTIMLIIRPINEPHHLFIFILNFNILTLFSSFFLTLFLLLIFLERKITREKLQSEKLKDFVQFP